jgi:hypothetical protein
MVPLAPVRFSITIDCPIPIPTCSKTMRGTISTALPAESGTTTRMVRAGHCCALAPPGIAAEITKRITPNTNRARTIATSPRRSKELLRHRHNGRKPPCRHVDK